MSEVCSEEIGDSDEDSSSSSSRIVASDLDRFRLEWREELDGSLAPVVQSLSTNNDKLDEAKHLFMKGIEAERNGRSGEAIYYYRRAIHLSPDVESTIEIAPRERNRFESESSVESMVESSSSGLGSVFSHGQSTDNNDIAEVDDDDDDDLSDLLERFRRLKVCAQNYCAPACDQTARHISDLPTEILVCIFNWVISCHLDTRSLDNLAQVCRGFYVLTRDESIWGKICRRIWKTNIEKPKQYGSWRLMYLNRPRVFFNGCYISKMSYIREGECSLDTFYQPVHVVDYFRFVRFYPNGKALMLTTPEDPSVTVYKLDRSCCIHGLLEGQYKLVNNELTLRLKRRPVTYNKNSYGRRQRELQLQQQRNNNINNDGRELEQIYHVEFEIKNCGKRRNFALLWKHYSVDTIYLSSGATSSTVFDLTYKNYPPMYFSPVRSYCTRSDGPL